MSAIRERSVRTAVPHEAGEISPALDPQLALDGRTNRRRRRFSDGVERWPRPASTTRVGSFADGAATHPEQTWERRVGSFADGFS